MRKQWIAIILAVLLLLALPGAALAAESSGQCGDNLTWSLDGNGTLTISGSGPMADFSLMTGAAPWQVEKHEIYRVVIQEGVTSVGREAFLDCTQLERVDLPESLVSIGARAFYSCFSLEQIQIPNGVTSLGEYAFFRCISLKSLELPKGLTELSAGVLNNCMSLEGTLRIPEGLTAIRSSALSGCNTLSGVILPEGVAIIEDDAFSYCFGLTQITLPASVTEFGTALRGCTKLQTIRVAAENPILSSVDGVLMSKDGTTLLQYPSGRRGDYSIPSGVTAIQDGAFIQSTGLISVAIPDTVTILGPSTFQECTALQRVQFGGVTQIQDSAFGWCKSLQKLDLPEGLTEIGPFAFRECAGLTDLFLPRSLTSIDARAFDACSNVTLFAYEGSYAQAFAQEHEIPFVPCFLAQDGEIRMRGPVSAVASGAAFHAASAESPASLLEHEKFRPLQAYDLFFEQDGEKVPATGELTFWLPLPEEIDPLCIRVFLVEEDGSLTEQLAQVQEDALVLTTDRLGTFAVAAYLPDPGDLNRDGQLSVADVVLLRKAILNNLTPEQEPLGDLNSDNKLSVIDVVLLRKAILDQK